MNWCPENTRGLLVFSAFSGVGCSESELWVSSIGIMGKEDGLSPVDYGVFVDSSPCASRLVGPRIM